VDALLVAVNPDRPENAYFTDYAQEALRWMMAEYGADRLVVALELDPSAGSGLPPDVLMAATQLNGKSAIVMAKPRFATFLRAGRPPSQLYSEQQKNDFAVGLIHEVLHLRRAIGEPSSEEMRVQEESRVWLEVNSEVVRPWRAANRPLSRRFFEVDDAFRRCGDMVPCLAVDRMLR
jgi:hypothetical protein